VNRLENFLFGSDGFRKGVFVPVFINLTTALLLFVIVAIFRDQIYERLRSTPKTEGFPITCLAEGYNNEKGEVLADVFIINRTGDSYDERKLVELLRRNSSDQEKNFDPAIRLKWIASPAEITVTEDAQYNANKGRVQIDTPGDGGRNWTIHVAQISDRAILKLIVATNLKRPIDRASKLSLPFTIDYRGE
jgi:hypothetical protein